MRIQVICIAPVPQEQMRHNTAIAVGLGVPLVDESPPHGRKLAVVGGGSSASQHLEELRAWTGDIWAINGACAWLRGHGIDSTFFSCDPLPIVAPLVEGASKAILASSCDPSAFKAAADVQMFHMENVTDERPIIGGCTTASRAPMLALRMGYTNVSFFGCEGSYDGETHAYKSEADEPAQLRVMAGGSLYQTTLGFMSQAENLAVVINGFPEFFHDRSGGLLGGMIADPDWKVAALSTVLRDRFEALQ